MAIQTLNVVAMGNLSPETCAVFDTTKIENFDDVPKLSKNTGNFEFPPKVSKNVGNNVLGSDLSHPSLGFLSKSKIISIGLALSSAKVTDKNEEVQVKVCDSNETLMGSLIVLVTLRLYPNTPQIMGTMSQKFIQANLLQNLTPRVKSIQKN
jgi:hypothetical protein